MSAPIAVSPRAVTRGESPHRLSVSIDYLSFTVPGGDHESIVCEVRSILGCGAEDRKTGLYGYTRSTDLDGYGIVCSGGDAQRGTILVSINGQGCGRIADFESVRAFAEPLHARLTRLDICADDHDAAVVDVSRAVKAWREGHFNTSGRPPQARHIDDFDSGAGKTLNVGARGSGKLCRVYEKGKQLGDPASRWCRAEVEWRNKDRVIPWDAVSQPVKYLAGAFPFFAFLSMVQERIKTAKNAAAITLDQLRRWVKLAAGKSINALLRHFDGDVGAVIDAVRREGFPERLRMRWESEAILSSP